mmetsp:Transcript_31463/g.73497  ORF Transcript_31463/g.73497 Transcript_31463/m.73497 type:complete len:466 (-) Transcript_31463:320-1717(-)|eukprot:CAMPEP_0178400562 /NCGR_PEP_ID=MMETSP0689_2-20121128/15853_1 /TAXON_ID=160604 /ORGANISM="Amphidinium massartii, Strain CS-259" /LENGTH=465 /DNA_ID=CAMNT_0020021361 /DNA_START=94 /DNA_END=1491 /DNA_ORIENTATION=-
MATVAQPAVQFQLTAKRQPGILRGLTAADLLGGRTPTTPVAPLPLRFGDLSGSRTPPTPPMAPKRVSFHVQPATPTGAQTPGGAATPMSAGGEGNVAVVRPRLRGRSWTVSLANLGESGTPSAAAHSEAYSRGGHATPSSREDMGGAQNATPTWGARPRAWTDMPERRPRAWTDSPDRFMMGFPDAAEGHAGVQRMSSAAAPPPQFGRDVAPWDGMRSTFAGDLCGRSSQLAVSVIAPGAGTGCNKAAFTALERRSGFNVSTIGQSRAAYDKYPPGWPTGGPAPNLQSWAQDLMAQGITEQSDCLVFGSRGGQVVLPAFWQALGDAVPPAVVINGGCARDDHPLGVSWPEQAVSMLIIGGKDYFKGHKSLEDYVMETLRHVPRGNMTTAVLLIDDMAHMPRTDMLESILKYAIRSVVTWKATGKPPIDDFKDIVNALAKTGWTGKLLHKVAQESWHEFIFRQAGC